MGTHAFTKTGNNVYGYGRMRSRVWGHPLPSLPEYVNVCVPVPDCLFKSI